LTQKNRLEGKRILIVDDEPDVLETLQDMLSMCEIREASTFQDARELLETEPFDIAVLDIMGVRGYSLLGMANEKNVIAVMLTGYALDPRNIVKSYREGAASYVPKDKMGEIDTFLNDILEAKEKGRHLWWRWINRLSGYFIKKLGPDWQEKEKKFWQELSKT